MRKKESAASAVWIAHGLVMNGGVLHCVESLPSRQLHAAIDGYRLFGLPRAADALLEATKVSSDAAELADRKLDEAYAETIPDDEVLARHINAEFPSDPPSKKPQVGGAAVASAIKAFVQASPDAVRLSSVSGKTREQHRAHRRAESALKQLLREWETGGHEAFLRLLEHRDQAVRLSAACYLVVADPDLAIPVLRELENVSGSVGTSAHMMLFVMNTDRFADPLAHLRDPNG